jgi:hypothetical protein
LSASRFDKGSHAMTFLEAAIVVISEAGRPMAASEILARAISEGLVTTAGQTPEATLTKALYAETRRPGARVQKLSIAGPVRAVRGSVRWTTSPGAAADA